MTSYHTATPLFVTSWLLTIDPYFWVTWNPLNSIFLDVLVNGSWMVYVSPLYARAREGLSIIQSSSH